jgi:hypothetical protein
VQKIVWVLISIAGLSATLASASEYSDGWGPPAGSALPVLEAYDQAGELRSLENLVGERGLLLFLARSADW